MKKYNCAFRFRIYPSEEQSNIINTTLQFEKDFLKGAIETKVGVLFNKSIDEANSFEIYQSLSKVLLDNISKNWLETRKKK